MEDIPMYHDGSRRMQDRFATRKLADRLVEVLTRNAFTDEDRAFIEGRPLFFLMMSLLGLLDTLLRLMQSQDTLRQAVRQSRRRAGCEGSPP